MPTNHIDEAYGIFRRVDVAGPLHPPNRQSVSFVTRLLLLPIFLALCAGCTDSTGPSQTVSGPVPDLGSMNVGTVRVLTFSQAANGLTIPASSSSAIYVVIAADVAGNTDHVVQYTVNGNLAAPSTLSLPVASTKVPSITRPLYTTIGGRRGAQFEERLRSYERKQLSVTAGHSALLRRQLSPGAPRATVVPTLGQQLSFNTINPDSADPCLGPIPVTATVEAVSNHAIVATDNRSLNNGFTPTDYSNIASEFDTYIYPTDVGYYGTPTDIDLNGGHVILLYTPSVNLLTQPDSANTTGFVGGFFFGGDLLPATPEPNGCPESNEGEIFYLLTPDPTGQFGNTFTTSDVRQATRGTVAHEFQHMINAGHRVVLDAPFESAWLDEGLAHLAEDNVGRAEQGYADLQTVTLQMAATMDTTIFNAFFAENFTRAQQWALRPDTVGAIVGEAKAEQDLAARGAVWALLRYTLDWFSNNNPRALTQALAAGPDTGTTNLITHAAPLDTLLAHWLITMYTDHQPIPNLPAQYNYKSYELRDIITNSCADLQCSQPTYLPVSSLGNGATTLSVGIPSASADYFIVNETSGAPRTIRVTTAGGGAASDPNGRLYVIRVH